jgi:LmbE family N-acetylglucosaminyl deacetylase
MVYHLLIWLLTSGWISAENYLIQITHKIKQFNHGYKIMKKIVVISVHPDDETLGCGGTLLKHYKNGDQLHWLILTAPVAARGYSEQFVNDRIEQISEVSKRYNFQSVTELNFEAGGLSQENESDIITAISKAILKIEPDTVYVVNRSDIHSDHRVAFETVMSATKSFRYPFIKKILMYECISETEMAPPLDGNGFTPNVFSDITSFIDEKIEIMQIYKSELQKKPMPRSIENIRALATFRGSTVGVMYAESFMLLREIN